MPETTLAELTPSLSGKNADARDNLGRTDTLTIRKKIQMPETTLAELTPLTIRKKIQMPETTLAELTPSLSGKNTDARDKPWQN